MNHKFTLKKYPYGKDRLCVDIDTHDDHRIIRLVDPYGCGPDSQLTTVLYHPIEIMSHSYSVLYTNYMKDVYLMSKQDMEWCISRYIVDRILRLRQGKIMVHLESENYYIGNIDEYADRGYRP